MSDRMNNAFAAMLTPPPSKGVQFSQGTILSWSHQTLQNTIEWRGITLTDIPIVEGVNALTLKAGDIVGMLGWAPENAKGVGSWWILGKLSNPGEFVADLTIHLGQVRYNTKIGDYPQVYIGQDTDELPLTILYYGDSGESRAIVVSRSDLLQILDRSGNTIFSNDAVTDAGIGKPYFNIPMVPSSGTSVVVGGPFWPAFTNAAYQEVMHSITTLWHPKISVSVVQSVTAGTIDWELRIDGITAGGASGTNAIDVDVPGWGTTHPPGDQVSVQLFARNTSGTQSRLIVDRCYGRQS